MTPTITERFDSRATTAGDDPAVELLYQVRGTENDTEVVNLVVGTSPEVYLELDRESIQTEPLGGGVWNATVRYGLKGNPADYEFDTSGGSQRIATSLATLQRTSLAGYAAPDYQGAINVSENRVEGTDVTVPIFTFSETRYYDGLLVTPAFKYQIFQLTGRVNGGAYKGFAKGEVLFLGASGSKRGKEQWAITFKFAASPNVIDQPIGPGNLLVSKEGWEYLWVRFQDEVDSDALIKIPVAFYVERVYPYGDLGLLGLGI
ncbi:hypothetical protein SH139x_002767 [Planctomycetaceae bacterium SH139]